jgi:hypothetical protein
MMKKRNLSVGSHGYLVGGETEIVEIIDDNFVMIHHHQLNLIFSTKDQMFNATKLVRSISDSEIKKWNETKSAKLFKQRFPQYFKVITTRDFKGTDGNRLSGTYMDMTMIPVIVAWCNPMLGYFLVNQLNSDAKIDQSGYVYLVQPEEHLDTNVYKIGRTWNPKVRFPNYVDKTKLIKCERVNNMYSVETSIISNLSEYFFEPFQGKEWYKTDEDNDLDMLIKQFEDSVRGEEYDDKLIP